MSDIVYMIILYKGWPQARRLIDRLDGEHVHFLVHIDRKSDDGFVAQVRAGLRDRTNCHFIPRETVHWGAWGLVQVLLNGARYIEDHGIPCDTYVYMSGQDYPLVSNEAIHDFFDEHDGQQFLEYFALPDARWPAGGLDRIEAYHFQVRGRHLRYPPSAQQTPTVLRPMLAALPRVHRKIPGGYACYGGSAATILAANGVRYLNSFVTTDLGRRVVRFFKKARHPDELFFQTVFLNSDLRDTVVNDELRYIDWNPPEGYPPKILRMEDFTPIVSSSKLFARKFDADVDADILDALDDHAARTGRGIEIEG
ncbi:glycosyl transferase family 14 [Xylanimonas cellulosilytica DSM 15894]|uniref:Peptide O-xylosyltransferase n=1 Tax=Xylanimonas cellulosilytica (strain DSM 15894 / JCM 12276 / CECT 5975 / KCTC 9989 / LMG 20990 / NBRC 107835 / XIL07) TaxID=446471 RepID=D1BZX5_XYLCX|nr:beta-1,6-N-acetylglucosaminyltransferase [Xylanimonas cellulosilytica]ACZ32103.1 glycosyl transferase family 14 [Xylanimonas cellulosilytica DSM 15894]